MRHTLRSLRSRLFSGFFPIVCFPLLPADLTAQVVLRGKVVEAQIQRPVSFAYVELLRGQNPDFATMTDSLGAFVLQVNPGGTARLRVTRIGFQQVLTRPMEMIAGDTITMGIPISASAIRVEPVIVSSALESGVLSERLAGLYRRKNLGIGYFISTERLQAANGLPLSDVLRGVPGISVSNDRSTPSGPVILTNMNQVQDQLSPFRRGRRVPNSDMQIGPCPVQLFIDGRHFRTQDGGIDVISTVDLIAVEVFRGLAEVPAEFSGVHARCGVISVWTRRQPLQSER